MTIIDWLKNRGIQVKNTSLVEQAFMHSSYAPVSYTHLTLPTTPHV